MNIWIINHYALTPEFSGGTRHYDIAGRLARQGHDVTIIASSFHYATLEEMKRYSEGEDFLIETIDGIRFVWIKTDPYRGNGLKRVWNMLQFTWKLHRLTSLPLPGPDVVVGSSVHLFAVYGAYRLAKQYGASFVMEVRDIWPQTLIDMGVSKWHPFVQVLGWLEPFLYRRADAIITLLPRASEHIERFGVSAEKIAWISNGVDIAKMDQALPSKRLDHGKFNILYAGTIGKANNLEVLIDAAKRVEKISDIVITIVGEGPLKEKLQKEARELQNVKFLPSVSKREVPGLLKEADVLFVGLKNLPLYRFGMSMNKVFDYMAVSKPVIFATNVFENPIKAAESGIVVEPESPESIAKAIERLYNCSEDDRMRMGQAGYDYVKNRFDIDIIASKFEALLKKVYNEKKIAPGE